MFAQLAPLGRGHLGQPARLLEPLHDPLTHLRGGFARERDGENAIGLDPGEKQALSRQQKLSNHSEIAGTSSALVASSQSSAARRQITKVAYRRPLAEQ